MRWGETAFQLGPCFVGRQRLRSRERATQPVSALAQQAHCSMANLTLQLRTLPLTGGQCANFGRGELRALVWLALSYSAVPAMWHIVRTAPFKARSRYETTGAANLLSEREPFRIALLDSGHRLAGHPGEGGDLSLQGKGLSRVSAMLQGVPVAFGSPTGGPMHPADLRPRTSGARHCSPLRFDPAWHCSRPDHSSLHVNCDHGHSARRCDVLRL
jgi:hypothetical protein